MRFGDVAVVQEPVTVLLHSMGDAICLAALLLGHVCPMPSLVTPDQVDDSSVSVRRTIITTDS